MPRKHTYFIGGARIIAHCPVEGFESMGGWDYSISIYPETVQRRDENQFIACPSTETIAPMISVDGMIILSSDPTPVSIRQAVPFAAALQGRLTLHASAVRFKGKIYAFVAASGTGKSTISARLIKYGGEMVSDDLLACRKSGQGFIVPGWEEHLRDIYFLSRTSGISSLYTKRITGKHGFVKLVHNGFAELSIPDIWKMQFSQYGQMVKMVPMYDLIVPDNDNLIDDTCKQLIKMWVSDQ